MRRQKQSQPITHPIYNPNMLHILYTSKLSQLPSIQPLCTSQRSLIQSIFIAFQGQPSQHFILHKQGFEQRNSYHLSHLTQGAVLSIISPLLQFANRLIFIRKKTNQLVDNSNSLILQNVGCTCRGFINKIQNYIFELQSSFLNQSGLIKIQQYINQNPMTLMQLSSKLIDTRIQVEIIINIYRKVPSQGLFKGPKFIKNLKQLVKNNQTRSAQSNDIGILISVLESCVKVEIQFLINWFQQGKFKDPFGQFCITKNLQINQQLIPFFIQKDIQLIHQQMQAINKLQKILPHELFLQFKLQVKNYKIKQQINSMLSFNTLEKQSIITRHVTQLKGQLNHSHIIKQVPQNNPYNSITKQSTAFQLFSFDQFQTQPISFMIQQKKIEDQQKQPVCQYLLKINALVTYFCKWTKDIVSRMLTDDIGPHGFFHRQFKQILKKKRLFTFLGQGAFWFMFLDSVFNQLQKVRDQVNLSFLHHHMQRSLIKSGCHNLIANFSIQLKQQGTIGWQAIEFNFVNDKFTDSLFFSKNSQSKILKYLLKLRRHQYILTRNWIMHNHYILKDMKYRILPLEVYRMKLLNYVNQLNTYCMNKVDQLWNAFFKQVLKVRSFKAISKCYESFLKQIIQGLFLAPHLINLYDRVIKCLNKVSQFNIIMQIIMIQKNERGLPQSKLIQLKRSQQQFDYQMNHLLDIIKDQQKFHSLYLKLTYNQFT